jgi:hypothetical protein
MRSAARIVTLVTICVILIGAPAGAHPPDAREKPGTLILGGRACDLLTVRTNGPLAGTGPCPGVRPGAYVETPKGFCTLNFLFLGSDGARYIGTAGHCVLGDSEFATNAGEFTWKYGKGPYAKDASGKVFGYFVYAVLQDPKDFALIRLGRSTQASPSMCLFGGPIGINATHAAPTLLHHFGNGTGIGDVLPGRTEVATDMSSADHVFANGVIAPGDSGAGAIDDTGKAVGVIVTLGAHTGDGTTDGGVIGITRLAPQLERARTKLKLKTLKLLTATYASAN